MALRPGEDLSRRTPSTLYGEQAQRARALADMYDIEQVAIEAGYHSCFACEHHAKDPDICKDCSFIYGLKWTPNDRWRKAHGEAT